MGKAGEMKNDELNTDMLSPEELEALQAEEDDTNAGGEDDGSDADGDGEVDDGKAGKDDDAGADGDGADADGSEDGKGKSGEGDKDGEGGEGAGDKDAEAEAAKKLADDEAAKAAAPDEGRKQFAPKLETNPERVKEIEARLGEVTTSIDELGKKLEDGDIEFADYHKEFTKLNDEKFELKTERHDLASAEKHNTMTEEQMWEHEQSMFFGQPENKSLVQIGLIRDAMNDAVVQIATDKANVGKSGDWILSQAKQRILSDAELAKKVSSEIGIDVSTLPAWKGVQKKEEPPKKEPPKKPEGGPTNLGDLPAAGDMDAGGEETDAEFAELDKLIDNGDVLEYESRLATMPTNRQEQYLKAGAK